MILTTTEEVPGKKISEILGVVRGNAIRSRGVGGHILASLERMVGGEITAYQKTLNEAREEALERMEKEAKKLRADAVVGLRFTTSDVMQTAAEVLVFGTAGIQISTKLIKLFKWLNRRIIVVYIRQKA